MNLRRLFLLTLCLVLLAAPALAGEATGSIKGKVIDKSTGEPLPFVNVILQNQTTGRPYGGASDFDGKFDIRDVAPGTYQLKATFTGYKPRTINGVVINADRITFYDIELESTVINIKEF
jgi:carboxypeptidase family protein